MRELKSAGSIAIVNKDGDWLPGGRFCRFDLETRVGIDKSGTEHQECSMFDIMIERELTDEEIKKFLIEEDGLFVPKLKREFQK